MTAAQQLITDNIDIWAAAIKRKKSQGRGNSKKIELYGIKKLRELILELAVRGLLVPQDPNDEPASELLKRIAAEKAKLIKDKKIKKSKQLPSLNKGDAPFKLPESWAWQRYVDVFYPISVGQNKIKTSDILEKGTIPVVDQGKSYVAGYTDKEELKIRLPGPVIIFGDHTSALKYIDFNFVAGADGVKILRPICCDERYFYLTSKTLPIESRGYGRHYSRLTNNYFPLPPPKEQHRIVAKVDELMALCDQLEQQTETSLSTHQTLVDALLSTLTNTASAEAFNQAWQRIAQHFDTLFTTELSIDQLKQTILQLAVMGKLVAQDPSDEPASELLKKIATEKALLIKDKKIKNQKPLPPISDEEKPFELPAGWVYTRMDDLCGWITSGSTPPKSDFTEEVDVPYLKVYNIKQQAINFEYKPQFINAVCNEGKLKRSILYPGDVVMNIVGPPLGKVAIIPNTYPEWNCNQAIAFFRPIEKELNSYIFAYLKAGVFLRYIELIGTAGQDNISVTKSRTIVLPMPPLTEQHRIVTKVNELMTLCDTLKTRLNDAQTTQLHLADSLAEQALS